MKTEYRPNAYYMRGALPTVEQSRDEYIGSVYGAAALDYITIIHANEAIDMLHERCHGEAERPEVRKRIRAMTGTKGRIGAMRLLELAISDQLAAKQGKRWNAEKKCIEDLPRWRASYNQTYFHISSKCSIIDEKECGAFVDEGRYNVGNYFRTREAAKKVASQIRDIFKNSKAE